MAGDRAAKGPLIPRLRSAAIRAGVRAYARFASRPVARLYHADLIRRTGNFGITTWLGIPIWQNVLDLWTTQEALAEVRPALLIETGTNDGGSAIFYAHVMEQLGDGRVLTIDIVEAPRPEHPRVTYLRGSSVDPETVARVEEEVARAGGPVMVILDSDHACSHVAQELELYASFVTPGSLLLSQDGVIDELWMFRADRPGPLPANRDFLARHPEFEYDANRTERYGLTHHPLGWMRRREI